MESFQVATRELVRFVLVHGAQYPVEPFVRTQSDVGSKSSWWKVM